MLLKKETLTIPVSACPKVKAEKNRHYYYAAGVNAVPLPRSGEILAVDIYRLDTGRLVLRFFSDGKNFINYAPEEQNWNTCKVSSQLDCWHGDMYATEKALKVVRKRINHNKESSYYSGILGEIDTFVEHIHSEKSQKAQERKYALMDRHFSMFPDYPKNLQSFCEKQIFGWTYFFISKINKGSRTAACGHCGQTFTVDRTIRQGAKGCCPHCKTSGKYYADWQSAPKINKAKICVCHKSHGNLLIRWTKVLRSFKDHKVTYSFEDYYRNLYLPVNGKRIIYAYAQESVWPYGYDWYRRKNGYVNYESTYLYTSNLRQVFSRNYYHVDLAAELRKNCQPIDFPSLLDNLKNIPQTEYFLRLGLYRIAADLDSEIDTAKPIGHTFSDVLKVSKQYLPLYQKYNISLSEHHIIRLSRTWISEESFLKLRTLKLPFWIHDTISELLSKMSFERFVNYFTKQKLQYKKTSIDQLMTWYRDYLSMSEQLKIDLNKKSIRFPSNLKEAHDKLSMRFIEVKNQVLDEQFRSAKEALYSELKEYRTDEFQIVLPQSRTDFIREGQALNHCVGNNMYYQNHLKGERMIFFIRKTSEPDKPFFTMELDMKRLLILQLYGFGDCHAPSDVTKFANSFLKALKPSKFTESRKVG
ncbi:PcfJ domain-containing protein [Caproicibacter fermentans]|uniref:PcfJ domain-containing protein n=1 Tax=Caproicibacter fermentans TaxID=2576756 RepID=A0A7G8TD95_9FIRM|nr:PcfJ domain-containing protein [Caproicibacter fermentans]QNK41586.1 PcfJ domain-containing protein [Caproicibacter fermentans]